MSLSDLRHLPWTSSISSAGHAKLQRSEDWRRRAWCPLACVNCVNQPQALLGWPEWCHRRASWDEDKRQTAWYNHLQSEVAWGQNSDHRAMPCGPAIPGTVVPTNEFSQGLILFNIFLIEIELYRFPYAFPPLSPYQIPSHKSFPRDWCFNSDNFK